MKLQLSALACAVLCAGAPALAGEAVWNEVGDAGQLMSTAQIITGEPGLLDRINGTLGPDGDVDLYEICLDQPSDFSAIAQSTVGGPSPILFLFDASGDGVKFAASSDPFAPSWFDNLFIDAAGHYFLGIASRDAFALDAIGQQIWTQSGTGSQFAPNGPGAENKLSQWNFTEGLEQGGYTVEIRGVDFFPPVPSPGAFALLGVAAGMFARPNRRR